MKSVYCIATYISCVSYVPEFEPVTCCRGAPVLAKTLAYWSVLNFLPQKEKQKNLIFDQMKGCETFFYSM